MGRYLNDGKEILFTNAPEGQEVTAAQCSHIADATGVEEAHFLASMANGPKAEDGGPLPAPFPYLREADKTCSVLFNPQNVDLHNFRSALTNVAGFADEMNMMKKLFFRGKAPVDLQMPQPKRHESVATVVPELASLETINVLHGLIGVITEAGEMAEVILNMLDKGEFDLVNVFEEAGDVHWYQARIMRGLHTDFEQLGRGNIDKLHGRHGSAFNVERDWNRNLNAERERLEASAPLFDTPPALGVAPPAGADAIRSIANRSNVGKKVHAEPPGVERFTRKPIGDTEGDCG